MKAYKKPYIMSKSSSYGVIPVAATAAGIAIGKAAFGVGVAAGLGLASKGGRFQITALPALEPVT